MTRGPELPDDPALERMLAAARSDLPDAQRMHALSASLSAKLGAGGGGGAPTDGGGTSVATGSSVPIAVKATGVIAALLVGGAIVHGARTSDEPRVAANPAPIASVAPAAAPREPEPRRADPIPTVSIDDLPRVEARHVPTPAPAPSASAAPEQRESEMALFRRAQQALASSPGQALALCEEHQQSFPRSAFAQEREVIAIDALVRLGRRSEAEARADRFASAYPSSAHNRRIDALLGR